MYNVYTHEQNWAAVPAMRLHVIVKDKHWPTNKVQTHRLLLPPRYIHSYSLRTIPRLIRSAGPIYIVDICICAIEFVDSVGDVFRSSSHAYMFIFNRRFFPSCAMHLRHVDGKCWLCMYAMCCTCRICYSALGVHGGWVLAIMPSVYVGNERRRLRWLAFSSLNI